MAMRKTCAAFLALTVLCAATPLQPQAGDPTALVAQLATPEHTAAVVELILLGPEPSGDALLVAFAQGPDEAAWRGLQVLRGWQRAAAPRDRILPKLGKSLTKLLEDESLSPALRAACWLGLATLGEHAEDAIGDATALALAESRLPTRVAAVMALSVGGKPTHKQIKSALRSGSCQEALSALVAVCVQAERASSLDSSLKSIVDGRDDVRDYLLGEAAGKAWAMTGGEKAAEKALAVRNDKLKSKVPELPGSNFGALAGGGSSGVVQQLAEGWNLLAGEDLAKLELPPDLPGLPNYGAYMQHFTRHLMARLAEQAERAVARPPESYDAWATQLEQLSLLDRFMGELFANFKQ